MIVKVVGEQPIPDREPPVHLEIDNADEHGGAEEEQMGAVDVEVVQMDQVLMDDDNFEVIEVQMNDDNIEIIEVLVDDIQEVPAQVEVVAPDYDDDMVLEIDISLQDVDEEVSE